jgi:ABC-type glycerol-3-phosphate transport system substrate-binding protein
MEDVLTDASQLILRGEATPQEALDEAAAEIDALLAE